MDRQIEVVKPKLSLGDNSLEDNPEWKIKDKEAYQKYIELGNSPILGEKRIHIASDGTEIDLNKLEVHIRVATQHLQPAEINKINSLKTVYAQTYGRYNYYYQRAFGKILKRKSKNTMAAEKSVLDAKQEEIIELFGRMHTASDVHRIIVEEWKLPCNLDAVLTYRLKHINLISELIEKHKRSIDDLRLGVKRSRLEELTYLYGTQKSTWKKKDNREDYRLLLQTIEQIRKEVEGDKLIVEGNIDINLDVTVNQHLQKEIFKTVNINQLILSRTAAKLGVDPLKLIKSLYDSYYSKFTGIVRKTEDVAYEEVIFPSEQPYDFDRIKIQNASSVANEKLLREKEKIEIEDKVKVIAKLNLKERMLIKIAEKNRLIEAKVNVVEVASSEIQIEREKKKNVVIVKKKK